MHHNSLKPIVRFRTAAGLRALFLAVALSAIHSRADTVALTITTNPPQGGTVTGAGTYAAGSQLTVQIQAANGWYISNVLSNGLVAFDYARQSLNVMLQNGDPTTITNVRETPILSSNTTYTASFAVLSPVLTTIPTNQVVITGDQVTLSAAAAGRRTIRYQWRKDGQGIPGSTNGALTFANVQLTNSGTYAAVASNAFGVTNTAPATLAVRDIAISTFGEFPLTSTVTNFDFGYIEIRSRLTNGSTFYTLDGSAPDFTSQAYTGPFFLPTNATIRAIAYSFDFSQFVTSAPLTVILVPTFPLDFSACGGTVLLDPPPTDSGFSTVPSNTLVTAVAVPDPGWTFMYWTGSIAGTSATNAFVMGGPKNIQAVFGTTLTAGVAAGNGTVGITPNLPLYPCGCTVRLEAIPAAGNYFAAWEGAVSAFLNLEQMVIFAPTQTVSALFAPLASNMGSLTVHADGGGSVSVQPETNVFQLGATNVLFATARPGQQFLGWSGDASGTASPLLVSMNSSKVITGHFSKLAAFSAVPADGTILMNLSGVAGAVYRIETSSDLSTWTPFTTVTNAFVPSMFSDALRKDVPFRMYRAVPQ